MQRFLISIQIQKLFIILICKSPTVITYPGAIHHCLNVVSIPREAILLDFHIATPVDLTVSKHTAFRLQTCWNMSADMLKMSADIRWKCLQTLRYNYIKGTIITVFTLLESSRPPASPQNLSNGCGGPKKSKQKRHAIASLLQNRIVETQDMCLVESQDICLVETQDMCCVES